jgi:hypothetical protein
MRCSLCTSTSKSTSTDSHMSELDKRRKNVDVCAKMSLIVSMIGVGVGIVVATTFICLEYLSHVTERRSRRWCAHHFFACSVDRLRSWRHLTPFFRNECTSRRDQMSPCRCRQRLVSCVCQHHHHACCQRVMTIKMCDYDVTDSWCMHVILRTYFACVCVLLMSALDDCIARERHLAIHGGEC